MSWVINPIMEWQDPRDGEWYQITDHGRSPLQVSVERIETTHRTVTGTMRRYVIAKKRTFTCSWENLPDTDNAFLTNGQNGQWMEDFHNEVDGSFKVRFRKGRDRALLTEDLENTEVTVMITDFSKEVTKRGSQFDFLSMDINLEEV